MNRTNIQTLTPPQQRFVDAYVKYGNLSKAIRLAYPEQSQQWSVKYQNLKGSRMMEKDGVKSGIAARRAVMEANATLAAQRIQTIIKDGKEHNALAASIFSIEQIDGKAKQITEVESRHTMVTYNLGGPDAPPIPAEVLAQLED